MTYLGEFRLHWRNLMAASFGLALGSAITHYTLSLFAPAMIADLGWSRAQFALIGSLPLLTMFLIPLAGRFTDRFGTRAAAAVGFTAMPLGFIGMGLMSGHIAQFFALYAAQHVFGILTTSMVFCRAVVERFDMARGIALSLVMSAPPLAGAIAAPLLGDVIEEHGWRAGYFTLAGLCALGGLLSVPFMQKGNAPKGTRAEVTKLDRKELAAMLRNPVLLLCIGGMFLVNVPQPFAASQMKLVLLDAGVADHAATWMVSLYAVGVIIGRFMSGLALDRVPPHVVALTALGLPAVGFIILSSSATITPLIAAAIMLVGLAQGAESDIGAYIISRRFDMKNFSLLLSLLTMMIGLGGSVGSLILSITLHHGGGYGPFLIASAVATLIGAAMFGFTGSTGPSEPGHHKEIEEAVIEQAIGGEIG